MSDFLINLALRAAGVAGIASPEIPASPLSELGDSSLKIPELVREEVASQPRAITSTEETELPVNQRPSATHRSDVSLPPQIPLEQHRAQIPLLKAQSPPERVREVLTDHREIVREAAPPTPSEVRESIREKEITREKTVEREVRIEALRPPERLATPQPSVPPTITRPEQAPIVNEIIREVVVQEPPTTQVPPRLYPGPIAAIVAPPQRPEPIAEIRPEQGPPQDRKIAFQPRVMNVAPARPAPRPDAIVARPSASNLRTPQQESNAGPAAADPVLRPAPQPEVPLTRSVAEAKGAAREKTVEVKIGSIEIRSSAPPPAPLAQAPEPAAGRVEAVEGFDAYRSVRRYSTWFRE